MDVHPVVDQLRDDLLDLSFGRPFLHHDDHMRSVLQQRGPTARRHRRPVRRRRAAARSRRLRLVDDAFEQPDDRLGPERAVRRCAQPARAAAPRPRGPAGRPRVPSACLISRSPAHNSRARSAARPAVRRARRCDPEVHRWSYACLPRPSDQPPHVRFYPVDQIGRSPGLRDHADQGAADHRGIGVPADLPHVLGTRDAEPQRHGQRRSRRECARPAPARRRRPCRGRR